MQRTNHIIFLAVCLVLTLAATIPMTGSGRGGMLFPGEEAVSLCGGAAFGQSDVPSGRADAMPGNGGMVSGRFIGIQVDDRPILPVYALVQDSLGFVWVGTDAGLFRHDGIRGQRFGREDGSPDSICNEHINVLSYDSGTLYVGTDRGFCTYDNAGGFIQDTVIGPRHVKSALLSGGDVWIGTTEGLYRRGRTDGTTMEVIPSAHIASACAVGDTLWFGGYGRIWRLTGGAAESFQIEGHSGTSGNLVLAIVPVKGFYEYPGSTSLFIGSEKGLFVIDLPADAVSGSSTVSTTYGDGSATCPARCIWNGGPVKNFLYLPDGSLAAGTDNGLLVLSPQGHASIFRHELRNSRSIPDNVVWTTMLDADGGLWVGTDHGAALTRLNDEYDFMGVEDCGLPGGLDVTSLVCAEDGSVFAAGMNGVLEYSRTGSAMVYKSDEGPLGKRLAHNKVRALYGDGESVWAASDGGLDRISAGRVVHYNIHEQTGKYLSDWMYAVAEDGSGRLWTGTYDGGLFITSKSRFPASGGDVLCDRHLCSRDGLSGDIVLKLCRFGGGYDRDLDGGPDGYSGGGSGESSDEGSAGRFAVVTDNGVDIVDEKDFSVTALAIPDGKRTLSLASDGIRLWVGTEAGVYVLDGQELRPISGTTVSAQSLTFSDGLLWLCDDNEIWRCDPDDPQWRLVRKLENPLLSIAADNSGHIYAGSLNGFYSLAKSTASVEARPDRIVITALYLDNVLVSPGKEYSGRVILDGDIALASRITLGPDQNSFALTFSSMKYPAPAGRFAYRLAGFHDEWQAGSSDTRAVFLNIPPGHYSFEVCHLDAAGEPDSETKVLEIRIRRPWYSTVWAYIAYLLLLGGVIGFGIYFRKVMLQLKAERAAKEKAQSIANSTVTRAQEFRETLSVIFGSKSSGGRSQADGVSEYSEPGAGPGSGEDAGSGQGLVSGQESGLSSASGSSGNSGSPDSKFMREIADIVKRHLDDPDFSAAALCEESHWPAKQIYRKIKQLTGLSTTEFIRDIRLQSAASLLKQGRYTVTEIMYKSGFTTASYFSKCFKARYGQTPTDYQKSHSDSQN